MADLNEQCYEKVSNKALPLCTSICDDAKVTVENSSRRSLSKDTMKNSLDDVAYDDMITEIRDFEYPMLKGALNV